MPWVRAAAIAGALYFVAGSGTAAIDPYLPDQLRFAWRLFSWVASAVVFAFHIRHEHFQPDNSPGALAFHVAAGVAFGGFLIAAAAMLRAALAAGGAPEAKFFVALAIWPVVTAVPAYVAALVAGAVLARTRVGQGRR